MFGLGFWGRISGLLCGALMALAVHAQSNDQINADEAFALLSNQEIVLVDIRTPQEWKQTGVAQGAIELNMLHPKGLQGFANELYALVQGNPDTPIVLICRTGNRTSRLQPILKQAGFTNIRHIPEGMIGSRAGPGWIKRGLPVRSCTNC